MLRYQAFLSQYMKIGNKTGNTKRHINRFATVSNTINAAHIASLMRKAMQ